MLGCVEDWYQASSMPREALGQDIRQLAAAMVLSPDGQRSRGVAESSGPLHSPA